MTDDELDWIRAEPPEPKDPTTCHHYKDGLCREPQLSGPDNKCSGGDCMYLQTTKEYVTHLEQSLMYLQTELAAFRGNKSVQAMFTCNNCVRKHDCRSVWDSYNTDGDCLEDK